MPHNNFELSFDRFRILNLSFSVNEEFKNEGNISITTQYANAHRYDKDGNKLDVRLKISSIKDNIPFFFEIDCQGEFSFREAPNEEILKNVSLVNAPAIMFPYVRETIADITRRAGFSPLHIAPINFVDLARQQDKEEKALAKKRSKKAPNKSKTK